MTDALTDREPAERNVQALAAALRQNARQFDAAGREVAAGRSVIEIPIHGGSMMPTLRDGDVAQVVLDDQAVYAPGDVIVFRQAGAMIAHRIVRGPLTSAGRRFVIARGDARLMPDLPVSFAEIVGRVTGIAGSDAALGPSPMQKRHALSRLVANTSLLLTRTGLALRPQIGVGVARALIGLERVFMRPVRSGG